MVEQWKSVGGKVIVRWNSKTVFVEQCGEQWNSVGSTVWYNSETVLVEQCDSGTVWWNSGTVLVE